MGKSCKEVAQSLLDCMKKTECIKKGGNFRECLRKDGEEDQECQVLRNAYFTCKRGQLDMRTRIKGPGVY